MGRVERKLHHADQLLVAARRSEGSPAQDVLTRFDGNATDDRRGRAHDDGRGERESQQHDGETARRHDRRSIRRASAADRMRLDPPEPRGYPRAQTHLDGRTAMRVRRRRFNDVPDAAGNGLLDRRVFLKGGAGALTAGAFMAFASSDAKAAPGEAPARMKVPGAPLSLYGSPASFEREVT